MSYLGDIFKAITAGIEAERQAAIVQQEAQRKEFQGKINRLMEELLAERETGLAREKTIAQAKVALQDCESRLQNIVVQPVAAPAFIAGCIEKDAAWVFNEIYAPELQKWERAEARILDDRYWLLPLDRLEAEVLKPWRKSTPVFSLDARQDCDDAAIRLAAFSRERGINSISIVIASGAAHAFNMVVFPDGTLWALEPQGAEWFTLKAGTLYDLKMAMVLL